MSRIGVRLRAAREAMKMSVREAAKEIGISSSYLSAIENGGRDPIDERVERYIARVQGSP